MFSESQSISSFQVKKTFQEVDMVDNTQEGALPRFGSYFMWLWKDDPPYVLGLFPSFLCFRFYNSKMRALDQSSYFKDFFLNQRNPFLKVPCKI